VILKGQGTLSLAGFGTASQGGSRGLRPLGFFSPLRSRKKFIEDIRGNHFDKNAESLINKGFGTLFKTQSIYHSMIN
jgi:hypothetical protein